MTAVDAAFAQRVEDAVYTAGVSRAAVEHDWPECHKAKCQATHPSPDYAFATLKIRIMQSVRDEIAYQTTSRADDIDENDQTDAARAASTLAVLMHRYGQRDGTWMRAAESIVAAYPGLVSALTEAAK